MGVATTLNLHLSHIDLMLGLAGRRLEVQFQHPLTSQELRTLDSAENQSQQMYTLGSDQAPHAGSHGLHLPEKEVCSSPWSQCFFYNQALFFFSI